MKPASAGLASADRQSSSPASADIVAVWTLRQHKTLAMRRPAGPAGHAGGSGTRGTRGSADSALAFPASTSLTPSSKPLLVRFDELNASWRRRGRGACGSGTACSLRLASTLASKVCRVAIGPSLAFHWNSFAVIIGG